MFRTLFTSPAVLRRYRRLRPSPAPVFGLSDSEPADFIATQREKRWLPSGRRPGQNYVVNFSFRSLQFQTVPGTSPHKRARHIK